MNAYKTTITSLGAALLLAASANASTQTLPFSFTPAGAPVLTFNQFNVDLADVVSIEITVQYTKQNGSLFIDNDSVVGGSGLITQSTSIDLTSTDVTLLDAGFTAIAQNINAVSSYNASVAGDDGDTDTIVGNADGFQDDGGGDNDGTTFSSVATSGSGFLNSLFFSDFLGLGTFDITVDGVQGIDVSAISGVAGTFTPADVSGLVTVELVAVPEPSSYAALAGVLVLAFVVTRRRKS